MSGLPRLPRGCTACAPTSGSCTAACSRRKSIAGVEARAPALRRVPRRGAGLGRGPRALGDIASRHEDPRRSATSRRIDLLGQPCRRRRGARDTAHGRRRSSAAAPCPGGSPAGAPGQADALLRHGVVAVVLPLGDERGHPRTPTRRRWIGCRARSPDEHDERRPRPLRAGPQPPAASARAAAASRAPRGRRAGHRWPPGARWRPAVHRRVDPRQPPAPRDGRRLGKRSGGRR